MKTILLALVALLTTANAYADPPNELPQCLALVVDGGKHQGTYELWWRDERQEYYGEWDWGWGLANANTGQGMLRTVYDGSLLFSGTWQNNIFQPTLLEATGDYSASTVHAIPEAAIPFAAILLALVRWPKAATAVTLLIPGITLASEPGGWPTGFKATVQYPDLYMGSAVVTTPLNFAWDDNANAYIAAQGNTAFKLNGSALSNLTLQADYQNSGYLTEATGIDLSARVAGIGIEFAGLAAIPFGSIQFQEALGYEHLNSEQIFSLVVSGGGIGLALGIIIAPLVEFNRVYRTFLRQLALN